MLYAVLQFVHVIAVILWVGGMFFAHCFLRPAAAKLEPPVRLTLMSSVLGPFLDAVMAAIALILLTGAGMIGLAVTLLARQSHAYRALSRLYETRAVEGELLEAPA